MKKILLFSALLLVFALCFTACANDTADTPDETDNPLGGSIKTEAPATTQNTPEEVTTAPADSKKEWPEDESKFTFFQVFEAPEGEPREIVMDYMMDMATIEWTPAEDFTIGWEGPADFDPNMSLKFYKDKKYTGTTYGNTHCTFELFRYFLDENNVFKYDNYSYEKIVGNNCSTTMTLAYQQIIDLPISVLKPISSRVGLLKLAGDLKIPEDKGDSWYSADVFSTNGQDAIYDAYATLESADILYKSIPGTGHTRMVRKVEVYKTAAGKLMPSRSYVYCVESTNAWFDMTAMTSTWYVDKKYTFSELYDTSFMPVTLEIFHVENPEYDDAYIAYEGTTTADNIKKGAALGTVSSNFPINYVMATVKDANGNVVRRESSLGMKDVYKYDMRKLYIKTSDLESGNYTLTLRAGIARGGVDFFTVDFTLD